ncbi:MAG: hydroxyacylglutathione hydrolase [Buchnera aphidicola (Eriosoma harunire)]
MIYLHPITALKDNYVWIISDPNKKCIIIDPGVSTPVLYTITKLNLIPIAILITHNHIDHVSGVLTISLKFPNIKIYGPSEAMQHNITHLLYGNETINLLSKKCKAISTPGHTRGHLSYYIDSYLFCGDTLFSGGCGKIYQEDYFMMFESFIKILKLPNNTNLCCGHEYTKKNLEFANMIYPHDKNIILYYNKIKKSKNIIISTIKIEKKINIFFRLALDNELTNKKNNLKKFIYLRKLKNKHN